MYIRKAILIIELVLLAVTSISAQMIQGGRSSSTNDQTQKTLRYVNPLVMEDAGRLADPCVIRYQGKYYLYLTGGLSGAVIWSSDDLVQWNSRQISIPEDSRIVAPGAFSYQGYVYLTGNNTGLFRSRDPLGPFEYFGDFVNENGQRLDRDICNGCGNGGVFDPAFLVDDDDRIYLYYAGGSTDGVYGVELDSTDPRKLLAPAEHFFRFETSHLWERSGSRNEMSTQSWIEGPWMTKRNGTYYLQYAAPGTEWKTYAVGVYTSKNPLGPFTYYEGSPILVHRNGLINGSGHHSIVEGPDGSVWAIYTLLYRNWNRMFERRIGMDPVGFDEQGNMFINGPTEFPQWAPGIKARPELDNDSRVIPLTEDKEYEVSSEAPGRNAPYALDNNIRTWWAPAENDAKPWMLLSLRNEEEGYMMDSDRIIFTLPSRLNEEGAAPRIRHYKIEVSSDGRTFKTVVDKTKNDRDNAVEFDEFTPVQGKFVKLTITGWPKDLPRGVIEFTVFGRPTPP